MTYQNGNLLFMGATSRTSLYFNYNKADATYQNQLSFATAGTFIGTTDTSSTKPLIIKKLQDNDNWGITVNYNLIASSKNSSKIIFTDVYTGIPILGQNFLVQNIPPPNTSRFQSSILFMGTLDCIFPEIPPVADFTLQEKRCTDTQVMFTDLSSDQPESWQWTFAGGTPATSTQRNPLVTFNTPGKHLVSLISTNRFGTGTVFSKEVTIDAPPVISISPTSACENTTIIYTATGAVTYEWSDLHTTPQRYIRDFIKDTIVTISGTSENGCKTTLSQLITVIPAPVVTIASIPDVCQNGPMIDFPAATPPGGTFSGFAAYNGKFAPAGFPVANYLITYSYQHPNGCTASATTILNIKAPPAVSFSYPNTNACEREPSAALLDKTYPAGGTFSGSAVTNGVFSPATLQAGTYSITYTYTDNIGCTNSTTKNITIHPAPVIQFIPDINNVCINQSLPYVAIPYGGTLSGTAAPNGIFNTSNLSPGFYTLSYTYTDPVYGCTNSALENITVASCVTPINSAHTGSSILYYPNPCNGSFAISNLPAQNDSYKILLYNAAGQLVKQMETASGVAITIDVKGVAAGLYHFKIVNTDTTVFENNIIIQ